MALDVISYALSKDFTSESLLGGGAVVGKNVTVSSINPIDGGNRVTFSYTLDDGTVKTSTMDVMDGKDGIDGLPGKNGKDGLNGTDGIGISKIEKIGTVDLVDTYRITFTDNSTFDYEVTNGKDGQGGSGSGEENKIDSISVNGVNVVPDENKNVDITVPDAYDDTDIRTELANKADSDHTHTTVNGHTVESDVPVDAKFTDTVYDDTQVKTQIQAVANGLMDSVGYSADYKTIDIIAKNGVKKSVNVAPIISHASITELSDVDTTNKATGKAIVYNSATSKHEYTTISSTDEKVKMDSSSDSKYLGELLDNVTITNENGELKVKKLDGQEVTITEINYLKGLTMNVMDLVNMFSNGGVKIINTPVATYAELLTLDKSSFIEGISYLVYVLADENHDNAKTTYLVDKDSETPTYFGFADSQRDFVTNPIDLATEITGKLGIANMDSDAIKALFTIDDTYKTETATNNAFSTHGAKALYDELLTAIGNKANNSDLTSHKDDTDIHVSTEDRTKWDSAKTHADSAHAPSNAQENVLETVKVNNQEITPDENKAVNIDLTGYAEHDEIVGENLIPYPYAQPERTTNGITFTFADDGSVIANGTATENADFSVCVRTNFGTDAALMLKPGIYAITGCPEGGSDSTYRIQVQFGDKTELKYSLKADYGKGFVFEVTEEYAQYACQIQCHVQKGYTVTDLVFKPMLVLGSVLKEYQPYKLSRGSLRTDIDNVAELASRVDNQFSTASGDYITVNNSVDGKLVELGIKGNSFQQTYSGKNLFNPTLETTTKNGVTCTNNGDGTYTLNGTASSDVYFNLGNVNIIPGNKYMLCCTKSDTTMKAYTEKGLSGYEYNALTATSSIANVTVSIKSGVILSNVRIKPMLTTDLNATYDDFEPYVGGIPSPNPSYPQPINSVGDDGSLVVKSCGKNLAKNANLSTSITSREVTFVTKSDGTIVVNGTPTQATDNWVWRTGNSNFLLRKGKYLWTGCPTNDGSNKYRLLLRNVEKPWKENNDYGNGVTFELTEDKAFCFYIGISYGYVANNLTFKPMLRRCDDNWIPYGDDLYEPYHETTTTIPLSEPLRSIGDVKDEITYQDGKWGVLRRIKKLVADTPKLINPDGALTGTTYDILVNFEFDAQDSYNAVNKISDMSKHIFRNFQSINIWDKDECGVYISWAGSISARLSSSICGSTLDEVKAYFKNNPLIGQYVLATPVFEPFADQTLPYLSTYDGVTNISNDDALSAEMTVKYPTTDASGVGSQNEAKIAELSKDVDDKFDEVKVLGWTVPKECPIQNYTDSDGVFHQRVGRVDLGSLEWTYDTLWKATSGVSTIKNLTVNMYHSVYVPTIANVSDMPTNSVKKADSGTLWINNGSSTEKPSGYLYFELATEITTNVDGNEIIGGTDISSIGDGTVTGGLSTIYNRINSASISERIDIKSEAATQYFTPCDGYVYLINNSGQTGTVSLFGNCAIGGNMGHFSCFVPAGTRIVIGGTINQLYFCKLQY